MEKRGTVSPLMPLLGLGQIKKGLNPASAEEKLVNDHSDNAAIWPAQYSKTVIESGAPRIQVS